MVTGENSPFRSLVLYIPDHQAKSTLCAFVWKQLGGEELFVWYYRKLSWCACVRCPALGQRAGIPSERLLFQMGKDLFNYLRIFDTCDDLDGATACVAGRYIDIA